MPPRSPRRLSLRAKAAASFAVAVAALSVMEGAARVVEPAVVEWQPAGGEGIILTGNLHRLWGLAPGVRRNGAAVATIGANGLRLPCPLAPRPAGRARVLVLGDSSFFGHGLQDDETIPVRLEAALRAAGIDGDVVNASVPGYSTEQSRILLEDVGWALEPTLVLVGSLWSDNNADGFRDADLLRTARLYRESPLSGSALFRLGLGLADRARSGDHPRVITWTKTSTWPEASTRRVPLQAYAANLDAIARDAAARGIGVAFVAPVNKQQLEGPTDPVMGWDTYFDAQRAVAAWHGVPVVSAADAVRGAPDAFLDVMHPNAQGADRIAQRAVATLTEAGWPAAPLLGRAEPFDPSGLHDTPIGAATAQAAQFSPQARLFPGLVDPTAAAPGPAKVGAALGPPTPGPTVGTVQGGTGPIAIRVRDPSGGVVGSLDLASPGAFSLPLDRRLGMLDLTATDGSGAVVSAVVERGTGPLTLVFP